MRCRLHAPVGKSRSYAHAVEPVGFPSTALVCGSAACNASAYLWLKPAERREYDRGQRVFRGPTAAVKVRAK